ncbi:MAG: DUF4382 domain-containing protein [Dehalococcoidales bacterium]
MKNIAQRLVGLVMILLLLSIAACAPVPGETTPPPAPAPPPAATPAPAPPTTPESPPTSASGVPWGTIEIRATDPPPADVSSAIVYLTEIEVHRTAGNTSSDNATTDNTTLDDTGGWITVIDVATSFDLMEVVNGVEAILGSANVMAGKYTQIRMTVDRVEVVTTDGDNFTAEVPSGKLKIVRPFDVGGGETTVLTLDFDGKKSLVVTGAGKFFFKPVVKLLLEHEDNEESEEPEAIESDIDEEELAGVILEIDGNEVIIELADGSTLTLLVDEQTIIELEDDSTGTVADLQVGATVEAKFDTSTGIASIIEVAPEEAAG